MVTLFTFHILVPEIVNETPPFALPWFAEKLVIVGAGQLATSVTYIGDTPAFCPVPPVVNVSDNVRAVEPSGVMMQVRGTSFLIAP
jgi:hypothetical protein